MYLVVLLGNNILLSSFRKKWEISYIEKENEFPKIFWEIPTYELDFRDSP